MRIIAQKSANMAEIFRSFPHIFQENSTILPYIGQIASLHFNPMLSQSFCHLIQYNLLFNTGRNKFIGSSYQIVTSEDMFLSD
jgi:hypothetical protein